MGGEHSSSSSSPPSNPELAAIPNPAHHPSPPHEQQFLHERVASIGDPAPGHGSVVESRARPLFDFDAVPSVGGTSSGVGGGGGARGRRFGTGFARSRGQQRSGQSTMNRTRRAAAVRGNGRGATSTIQDATMQPADVEVHGSQYQEEDDDNASEGDDEEYVQGNEMEDEEEALPDVEEDDEEYGTSQANQSSSRPSRRGKAVPAARTTRKRASASSAAQAPQTVPVLNTAGSNVAANGKLFQCSGFGECRMVFSRSEHLARHIRKHTGERPFKCRCGRSFSRLDNLRQHSQTVHHDQPEQNAEMLDQLSLVHSSLSIRASIAHKAVKAPVSSASASSSGSGSTSSHQQQQGAPPRKKQSFSVQSTYTSSSSPATTSGSSGITARGYPAPVYHQAQPAMPMTRISTRSSQPPNSATGSRTKRRINPEAYREHPYPNRSSSSDATSNASLSPITPLARLPGLPQLLPEHYEETSNEQASYPHAFAEHQYQLSENEQYAMYPPTHQDDMYPPYQQPVSRGGLPSIDALISVTNAEADRLYPASFPPTSYGQSGTHYLSPKPEWRSSVRPATASALYYESHYHYSEKLYPHQQERPLYYLQEGASYPAEEMGLYAFTTGRSKSLPDYERPNRRRYLSFSSSRDSSEERMDYQSGDSGPAISLSTIDSGPSEPVQQQMQKTRSVKSLPNMRLQDNVNVLPPLLISPQRQVIKPSLGQSPIYHGSPRSARSTTPYEPINWNHHGAHRSSQDTFTKSGSGNLSPPLSASRRTISAERSTSQIAALVRVKMEDLEGGRGLRASSDDMAETASLMSLSRLCGDETRMETPELENAESTVISRKRAREDDNDADLEAEGPASDFDYILDPPARSSPITTHQHYVYPHLQQRPPHSPSLLHQRLVHQ